MITLFENFNGFKKINQIFSTSYGYDKSIQTTLGQYLKGTNPRRLLMVKDIPNVDFQKFLNEVFLYKKVQFLNDIGIWQTIKVHNIRTNNKDFYFNDMDYSNKNKVMKVDGDNPVIYVWYSQMPKISKQEQITIDYINKHNEFVSTLNNYNL